MYSLCPLISESAELLLLSAFIESNPRDYDRRVNPIYNSCPTKWGSRHISVDQMESENYCRRGSVVAGKDKQFF
jgi:hypothetical protein